MSDLMTGLSLTWLLVGLIVAYTRLVIVGEASYGSMIAIVVIWPFLLLRMVWRGAVELFHE